MNGKYLLDTNAIINLLKDSNALVSLRGRQELFFCSIITEIELLSFKYLTSKDETAIKQMLPGNCIINITQAVKARTIELKRNNNIKLPDAVICATAQVKRLTLITDDKKLFNIPHLDVISLADFVSRK